MQAKNFVRILFLVCCFNLVTSVFAQLDLNATYMAKDESFEFKYPSDWTVDDSDYEEGGFVYLTAVRGQNKIVIGFVDSLALEKRLGSADTFENVFNSLAGIFAFKEDSELEVDSRRAIKTKFTLGETSGIAIIIEMNDARIGMVLITTSPENALDEIIADVIQIVATFNNTSSDSSKSITVQTLNDYNSADWRDAIAELENEGLIHPGGVLIFNELNAFFNGLSSWFTPLARNTARRDIVMAAELRFNSDSNEYESCSLMARLVNSPSENGVNVFLEVGIDNSGFVYWIDRDGDDVDSDTARLDLDLDKTHHLLFLALNDRLTVYVDGELVFDKVRIPVRTGSFGIALLGREGTSRCAGKNIWAYDTPVFVVGLCEVRVDGIVNIRTGPSRNFELIRTLTAGDRIKVKSQAVDSNGSIWYELEDASWLREDVITLMGDCGDIPEN